MWLETDRIVDAGDTTVMVGTVRGVGIGSGEEVQIPIAFVSVLRDGKTTRVEEYLNPAEALEALGLVE
jgi:ketosteroid isomerase-like protein